jgi:hypothetical protein
MRHIVDDLIASEAGVSALTRHLQDIGSIATSRTSEERDGHGVCKQHAKTSGLVMDWAAKR